jgi:hypothetical protein
MKSAKHYNLQLAAEFISALTGNPDGYNEGFQAQCFTDDKSEDETALWSKNPKTGQLIDPRAKVLYGTLNEIGKELIRRNQSGACISITVNKIEGTKRRIELVTKVRALFLDGDFDKFSSELKLKPSFVVRRGNNFHPYFLVSDMQTLEFSGYMASIAAEHTTDPVIDLSRAMRLPGFFHQKDSENPQLVTLEMYETCPVYTTAQIAEQYPYIDAKKAKKGAQDFVRVQVNHSDEELLNMARNASNGTAFTALYDYGDTSAYGGDHTRADLALCNMLLFWFGAYDAERIFRSSALMRSKWDEARRTGTYGSGTMSMAVGSWNGTQYGQKEDPIGTPNIPKYSLLVKDNEVSRPTFGELVSHYIQNTNTMFAQAEIVLQNAKGAASQEQALWDVYAMIMEVMSRPENYGVNEQGQFYLDFGGTNKITKVFGRNAQDFRTRLNWLSRTGLIGPNKSVSPSGKSGPSQKTVVYLPDNCLELPMFQLDAESSKSIVLCSARKEGYRGGKLSCPSPVRNLNYTKYVLRSAFRVANVLSRHEGSTVAKLMELTNHSKKYVLKHLQTLEGFNLIFEPIDGGLKIDYTTYMENKILEQECSDAYRGRFVAGALSSMAYYSRMIKKETDSTILRTCRRRYNYHLSVLNKLNDGIPVNAIFGKQ